MQFIIVLLAALVCTVNCIPSSQSLPEDPMCNKIHPFLCRLKTKKWLHTWSSLLGNITLNVALDHSKLFGTVGKSKEGLFSRAGYKKLFFDDDRGKLEGQVHFTTVLRLLGVNRIKNYIGGKLFWSTNNAYAIVDVRKPVGEQKTTILANGGILNFKNNTDLIIEKLYATVVLRNKAK